MSLHIETDLPTSLAPLKNVETLLRCPICFDFLNITMMTKCSHNFCSLCIRKFLSYKLQCPVCNRETIEQDLRNNRLLDDLVSSFQAARQQLSKAMFESPPKTPSIPAVSVRCKTPREKTPKSNSAVLSQFFQKKPKAFPIESKQDGPVTQFIKEEPMDVELPSVSGPVAVKQEEIHLTSVHMGDESSHSSSPSNDVKPVIKVDCPVCSVSVAQNFINKHLDMCLSSGEKKESLRSSLGKSRRPMAKLVYNLLSMQELKRRLKDCQLSVQGTREQLIKKHQEFIHIYNAQCDSLNPKSVEDIAKEVEANEKMRTKLKEKAQPVLVFSKDLSEKDIDDMHSSYRKQHSGDFTRLIAQVRGRLHATRPAEVTAGRKEAHTPTQDSKGTITIDAGDSASDEELCSRCVLLSSSPTSSEVSVSSSISDIFGPEPPRKPEAVETTPSKMGKRLRKSQRGKTLET
ncbi:E3 ubiquitin-protein ligase RAD18 isoform X1 [Periophthalmus magnuspinnatus]|uniref:E3 ubiquitin-protein ligase RAD18 isoform X1 n=1 Tax=Periophthalmus magnuspinnatus TaxID=409849 RepID=UPI0024372AA6|nr:E3 ubiquitin-protein ligase RAD18 isoform X1 [Periophthalmus magnuspinnatus]